MQRVTRLRVSGREGQNLLSSPVDAERKPAFGLGTPAARLGDDDFSTE
jgi:hypothetical protein